MLGPATSLGGLWEGSEIQELRASACFRGVEARVQGTWPDVTQARQDVDESNRKRAVSVNTSEDGNNAQQSRCTTSRVTWQVPVSDQLISASVSHLRGVECLMPRHQAHNRILTRNPLAPLENYNDSPATLAAIRGLPVRRILSWRCLRRFHGRRSWIGRGGPCWLFGGDIRCMYIYKVYMYIYIYIILYVGVIQGNE